MSVNIRRWTIIAAIAAAALAPLFSSQEALAACSWYPNSVDRLEVTQHQTVPTSSSVTVTVHAYDCDGHDLNESIEVGVSGMNIHQFSGETPFTFTYPGTSPGTDSIKVSHPCVAFYPCESHPHNFTTTETSVDWTPTAINIDANGSIVKFTKSSGNPKGGVAAFECDATAPYATQVSITSCKAYRFDDSGQVISEISAPVVTVDGVASATAGSFTTDAPNRYRVCWSVLAVFPTGDATTQDCDTSAQTQMGF